MASTESSLKLLGFGFPALSFPSALVLAMAGLLEVGGWKGGGRHYRGSF